MSFLTPLYLLGVLAVSLPIVFHMIRRTPRGRRDFSSLMFLDPSPPRVTRRSRIEHWLLLMLRAAAVCLLAFAFARPYLRVMREQPLEEGPAQDMVILVDTSASMRRDGLWNEAVERVERLLDAAQPLDRICLATFDVQPRLLVDFGEWSSLGVAERVTAARQTLRDASPGWGSSGLARALIDAAERLDSTTTRDELPRPRTIVVVSDLQEGSRCD
ncbi:MAG: BatA domain-containing protein, partial [Planctomycetaceae bacterium]|nr:BatA domain-containing protein [Planctomycetaceae bacterium]